MPAFKINWKNVYSLELEYDNQLVQMFCSTFYLALPVNRRRVFHMGYDIVFIDSYKLEVWEIVKLVFSQNDTITTGTDECKKK